MTNSIIKIILFLKEFLKNPFDKNFSIKACSFHQNSISFFSFIMSVFKLTGNKAKDATLLETNGVLQRFLSNINGMDMRAECALTGAPAITFSPLLLAPTLPKISTIEEQEQFDQKVSSVQMQNLKITANNNQITKAKCDVRMELCTSITNCPIVFDTIDNSINVQTLTSLELYKAILNYLTLNTEDIDNFTKIVEIPFNAKIDSIESMEQQVNMYEREIHSIYNFTSAKSTSFRDNEKVNHLKSRYGSTFAPAIALANAHHSNPSVAQIMTFIINSAKTMDRENNWRSNANISAALTNPTAPAATKKPKLKYCWSHGPNTSHSPVDGEPCMNPAPGHQEKAKFKERLGGKNTLWVKGQKTGP